MVTTIYPYQLSILIFPQNTSKILPQIIVFEDLFNNFGLIKNLYIYYYAANKNEHLLKLLCLFLVICFCLSLTI